MTNIKSQSSVVSNAIIQSPATALRYQIQNHLAASVLATCSQQIQMIAHHISTLIQYDNLSSRIYQNFAHHFVTTKTHSQTSTTHKAQEVAHSNALVPYNPINFAKLVQEQQEKVNLAVKEQLEAIDSSEGINDAEQTAQDLMLPQEQSSLESIQKPEEPNSIPPSFSAEFYQRSEKLIAHDIGMAFLNEISQLEEAEILNSSIYIQKPDKYHKYCPHLANIKQILNNIAYSIVQNILSYENIEDRIQAMEKFIRIAHMCFKDHNIAGAEAILASLNYVAINRLEETREALSIDAESKLKEIERYFDNQRNSSLTQYRKNIEHHLEVAIPNMTLFLPPISLAQTGLEKLNDLKEKIRIKKIENEYIEKKGSDKIASDVKMYTQYVLKIAENKKEPGKNTMKLSKKINERISVAVSIAALSDKAIKQKYKDNLAFIEENANFMDLMGEREKSIQVIVDSLKAFAQQAKTRMQTESISPYVQQMAHWHLSAEGKRWDEEEAYQKACKLEPRRDNQSIFI